MPWKKDLPPSAMPPRRSARGLSRSASSDGDDSVELMVPTMGLGNSQEGLIRSPFASPVPPITVVCDVNKEASTIPSVSVSSDESVRDVNETRYESPLKNSHIAAGNSIAEKPGFAGGSNTAGVSDSESSDSPGVQPLLTGCLGQSGSLKVSDRIEHAGVGLVPPRTPLFSPEFKAMLSMDYPKTSTVFSPNAPPQNGPVHKAMSDRKGSGSQSRRLCMGMCQRRGSNLFMLGMGCMLR
ncbi:hypothetical protein L1987_37914 [Smallanthus sonchifolius]|uniref:Uncharacterized protein n=1 Tax=Smallanthus sonchifolius TaxID=185202 RepID=A0ACB9HH79_9ASTR|nr:hypothetical protein L1987_37914 [Smallanthus sonchifolius]